MAQVTVVARVVAKPGMEDVVKKTLMGLVPPTRKESGCINYDLHISTENTALFLFYENWTSKKDLDDHLAMPYLQDFLGRASEILAEPVDISLWERVP
ncbi:MAG: antibiotic biosynthesis monooxygenase [Deltaproteobacteria bacterium]|nr:antibiotic biosynthesis monooxygenase [Deltaproteobacteria bacterium]